MRNILWFIIFGMLWMSCDNSLNVNAEFIDVPVVYSLLNQADTAQYIKVERVFQSKDGSALDNAKIIDSLYYPNAQVSLVNVRTGKESFLERVNGNDEGYPREDGVFLNDPNFLYKVLTEELDINDGDEFLLQIDRGNGLDIVTSTTYIIEEPVILTPSPFGSLHFSEKNKFNIRRTESENGKVMDATFTIHVKEIYYDGSEETTYKSLVWDVVKVEDDEKVELEGVEFYSFLNGELEEISNVTRVITGIDFKVVLGGKAVQDFLKLGVANQFSITSSEAVPNFSNLTEGIGIFSSVNQFIIEDFELTASSIDSLEDGRFTKHLNFFQ